MCLKLNTGEEIIASVVANNPADGVRSPASIIVKKPRTLVLQNDSHGRPMAAFIPTMMLGDDDREYTINADNIVVSTLSIDPGYLKAYLSQTSGIDLTTKLP